MTTIIDDLEAQRNRLTADLFAAIKADPWASLEIQAAAARLTRVNRAIAEESQSDASSADPLGVGA